MGLYNSQGALLLPGRIDYIGSFVDGKAPVWLNSVLGWIDTERDNSLMALQRM